MPPARPDGTPQMHGHSQHFHHHQAHNHDNHPRSPNDHQIQFYNGEDSLFDSVSRFILPSFFSNEHAAIIVATKAHLDALDLYLRQQNLVPELLRKREQMLLAPAEGILKQLMPNGRVDVKIFNDFFTPLFEKLQEQYPKLLIYGELVNVLCENGEHEQAHELEEVWEAFLEGKEASLLCGYNLNVFASDGLEDVFQRICRSHSHVMPAEEAANGNAFGRPEDQPMVLAMLQQKNLRLEAEMARRAALESVLRATMEHIGTRPAEAIQVLERDGSTSLLKLPAVGVVSAMTNDGVTEYYFNNRFLEISGLTRMSIETEPGWVGAVHYQDRERVSHNIRLVDCKTRRMEYRFVLPDGSIRWVVGESVSREAGYVHSAVDITVLRTEITPPLPSVLPALPSARSRSGSTASGSSVEPPPWVNTHLGGHKRSIGFSHVSSPSGPSSGSGCPSPANAIFTRSRPNDLKVAADLTRLTQSLWENLFSHPHLLHPPSLDSAEANIATRLSALYTWYREQPRIFMPGSSTFDINIDALQKANIRLTHIEFFGSVILLSRYPLIRAIERGDLPRDTAQPRRETAAGSRKNELDDLQYAEGCIEAAINVLSHVQTLVAPIPPSASNTSSLAIFVDHNSDVRDVRSCRAVLGVFFAAAATVLLHLSLQPEGSAGFRHNEELLGKVSGIIDDLVALPETQDMARNFRATLGPFISALFARYHSRYPHQYPESTPLGVPAKTLISDITALLKHPTVGVEWLPFEGPLWTWQDLLSTPGLGPVGDRMVGDARTSSSDRTFRGGEGESSPARGTDKRARISNEESSPSTAARSSMEAVEEWNLGRQTVSKDPGALFNKNSPPAM